MKHFLIFTFGLLLFSSCNNNEDNNSIVKIRLENASDFDYSNITINTSTGNVSFEAIKSGEKTEYKKFELAYNYAFVQLDINGETYTLQPIDYVGEKPLKNGDYTYKIGVENSQNQETQLSLTLIKD